MRIILWFCLLTFTPVAVANSVAIVDPGATGPTPSSFDVSLTAFNGVKTLGQNLSIDLVFADHKWITTDSPMHGILLMLQTNYCCDSIDWGLHGSGALLDFDGNDFTGVMPFFLPGIQGRGGMFVAFLYTGEGMPQPNPISGNFRYYGIHYDVQLPNFPNVEITSAQLRIVRANGISVPEGSATWLIAAAFFLIIVRLKHDKPHEDEPSPPPHWLAGLGCPHGHDNRTHCPQCVQVDLIGA